MDRNFKVSLIKSTGSEVTRVIDFRGLVRAMLHDEDLQKQGAKLRRLAQEDKPEYDRLKRQADGFVIGEFSYRNADSCITYEPVMGFDIDKLDSVEKNAAVFEKLKGWPFSFVVMPSISGLGLRLLVYTDATKDTHKDYYQYAARTISSLTGIPTKSSIKEALQKIGHDRDYIQDYLDMNAHIDDATSDISRFWYYSGINKGEFYANKESQVFTYRPQSDEPERLNHDYSGADYPYVFTERDKVEYLIGQIESSGTDITKGVPEWFKIGLALYDEFGNQAEDYFYRVSRFHPDYTDTAGKREWRRVESKYKPGKVTIGSFYKWCADYNINIDFNALVEKHSDKFNQPKHQRIEKAREQKTAVALHDASLERSIIATCIYRPEYISSIYDACPKFSDSVFEDAACRGLFQCIAKMEIDSNAINPAAVASKAQHYEVENAGEYISSMKGETLGLLELITNAEIAYSLYLKRKISALCDETKSEIRGKDISAFDCLDSLYASYASLSDYGASKTEYDAMSVAKQVLSRYDLLAKLKRDRKDALTGVTTGLAVEDNLTCGYQPTDLVVIAARPGMGKTSKVLKTVSANCMAGVPIGVFSLEMSAQQLGNRMAAMLSGINSFKIRNAELGPVEQAEFVSAIEQIADWPLFIDDKGGASIMHIDRQARKWSRKHGIRALVIDYLQLITTPEKYKREDQKISALTKHLKFLAKSLNIPVILLSQLNRSVEVRGGTKRPLLSDLRESGAIEEDADIVAFIYRPEYYDILEDGEGNSLKGVAEIIYSKHRNGALKTLYCRFNQETTEFFDNKEYSPAVVMAQPPGIPAASRPGNDDDIPF